MLSDLKFAMRQLRKSPGFAVAVILTVALGIGVNAAVFSMLDGFLLRRLPYPEPNRIGALMTHVEGHADDGHFFTYEDDSHGTADWRLVNENLTSAIAAAWEGHVEAGQDGVNLKAGSGTSETVRFVHATAVSVRYFEVLGIRPYLGREFTDEESRAGGPKAAIISYGLWQTMFHGDRSLLGSLVEIKGEPHTVVGILPPNVVTPQNAELWNSLQPSSQSACSGYDCGILLRLKPNSTWQQVQTELGHLYRPHPGNISPRAKSWLYPQPLQQYLGGDMRPRLLVLMLAVGFILLIACANLAGLVLVRISRRVPELATRMALGASRFEVLRQVWVESLVLTVIGASAGIMLAGAILRGLQRFLPESMIPLGGFGIDLRVLLFSIAATLVTSLLIGALPPLVIRRLDLRSIIATNSKAIAGGSRRLRAALISMEVALSVMLVAACGLLVRTLAHLETLPSGFDAHKVMTATASLDELRYREAPAFLSLLNRSVAAMKNIPSVEDAAVGLSVPYQRGLNLPVLLNDGKNTGESHAVSTAYVTPEYFATLRMPILAGRNVRETDTSTTELIAVVNESFARKFFGESNAVGRHFSLLEGPTKKGPAITIVGVVGDVTKAQGVDWTAPLGTEPVFYLPATQFPAGMIAAAHLWFQPSWIVRTRGPISGLASAMERAMAEADPNLPFAGFHSMEDLMQQELQTQRIEVLLLSTLAGLALLLSAIGIYALVSNLVVQRTREIGIRMALGASVERAMVESGSPGVIAAAIGLAVGLGLCFAALRVLRSELYGVGVYDPMTLFAAPALLALMAVVASWLPARHITHIDPALTLRSE